MLNEIKPLHSQLQLQTRLLKNAVAGMSDKDAQTCLNDKTNHVVWLAGHTVSSRVMLANCLGIEYAQPYPELYDNGKGMEAGAQYPVLADLMKDWDPVTEKIEAALENLDENFLKSDGPFQTPMGGDMTSVIGFMMHHESYTIGQIGIARKFFGLESMKYN